MPAGCSGWIIALYSSVGNWFLASSAADSFASATRNVHAPSIARRMPPAGCTNSSPRRAMDAAATAGIGDAHRDHVAARAQRGCRHRVFARQVVLQDGLADLVAVDVGDVAVVDAAHAEQHARLRFRFGQRERRAIQATPSMPIQPPDSHRPGTGIDTSDASKSTAPQPRSSATPSGQADSLRRVSANARSSASRASRRLCAEAPASSPSVTASIHASMRLPPRVLSMMPIGTPVLLRSSRAM